MHRDQAVAYFDGPGGTQVPTAVVEAMSDYLLHHNANTHWAFPSSMETDAIILRARAALADFLNAAPNEIAFGANMTTLTFHLARALGRGYERGDEIVLTELDHHANIAPWRALEQERGVTIRMAKIIPETRAARLGGFRAAAKSAHQAGRDRRRLQRARDHHRRPARGRTGARGRRADFRRCGALRAAPTGRCARDGLRFPRLLGL